MTIENSCKIGYNGEYLFLLDQYNKPINGQISLKLSDCANDIPTAEILVSVDLSEVIDLRDKSKTINKTHSFWRRFLKIFNIEINDKEFTQQTR